jgi:hypothetical protein
VRKHFLHGLLGKDAGMTLALALGSFLGLWSAVANPPPISWHTDLASAEAAAERSDRAMLVVFR